MSDDSETVEDTEKGSLAEVTDDSCTVEFIEIVPLDRASDDYHKLEFIDPVVEVKPEDLLDMKRNLRFIEPVVEVKHDNFLDVKEEPADERDDIGDVHYSVKQEPADDSCSIEGSCFTVEVSLVCTYYTYFYSSMSVFRLYGL